jgi:hypothetical protein
MALFDLSGVVESFSLPDGLQITRRGVPTFTQGLMTATGSAQTFTASPAFVHPTSGREVMGLPEGLRSRETITVYSAQALRGALEPGGTQGDLVAYNGVTYEVQTAQPWADLGTYYRALATKVPVA